MYNVEIPNKNKSRSLFYINPCSLKKNFDDLLSCTKNNFNITGVTETTITKQLSFVK